MLESFWSWLNTPPTTNEVLDLFGTVYVAVFAAGFLASAYLAGPGADTVCRNAVQRDGTRHWAKIGLWIFGIGLFFFAMRAFQINPGSFGEPIWLVGSVIALMVAAVRCVEWWRTIYPERLESMNQAGSLNSRGDLEQDWTMPVTPSSTGTEVRG